MHSAVLAQGRGNGSGGGGGGSEAPYQIIPFAFAQEEGPQVTGSWVSGLNDSGQAVGTIQYGTQSISYFLEIATGTYTELPGEVQAISDAGQIVGVLHLPDTSLGYFMAGPDQMPVVLPLLAGDTRGFGLAISDDGVIVGFSARPSSNTPVAWRVVDGADSVEISGPIAFELLTDGLSGVAEGVCDLANGTTQVVGEVNDSGHTQAVTWTIERNEDGTLGTASAPTAIGTLGLYENTYSYAFGVNAHGAICGQSDRLPILYTIEDGMQSLPVPRDTQWGRATGINDRNEVVAEVDVQKITRTSSYWPAPNAYLWSNGVAYDLETLIPRSTPWEQLWVAYRINNHSVIAGQGRYTGVDRNLGFIMIPLISQEP